MDAVMYPIRYAVSSTSRGQKHFIARTFEADQIREFCRTFASQADDTQEVRPQRHPYPSHPRNVNIMSKEQLDLPDKRSLVRSTSHCIDLCDSQESSVSLPDMGPRRDKTRVEGRLLKARKKSIKEDVDSALREKLTEREYTTKELQTMEGRGKHTFLLKAQHEIASLKGRWTEPETEILKEMRGNHVHTRIIANRLGREEQSIKDKIRILAKYFQERNEASRVEGPQILPAELEDSIFQSRFLKIWKGLMASSMAKEWDKIFLSMPLETWFSSIRGHTPERVKSLLASYQPPTVNQLESLEWSDTTAAGVFGWVLKPKSSISFDNECYLYVSSTSRFDGGLRRKKLNLLSTWPHTRHDAPKPYIKNHNLSPKGKFVTLFEIPFKDDSDEEVRRVRRLVTLARAVYAIWLGAFKERSGPVVNELVPWDLEHIRYQGFTKISLTSEE